MRWNGCRRCGFTCARSASTACATRRSPPASAWPGRVIEDMYKIMAIADYEDRFAIPTAHREQVEDGADIRGGCGFTDGNGCSTGSQNTYSLFGGKKTKPLTLPTENF